MCGDEGVERRAGRWKELGVGRAGRRKELESEIEGSSGWIVMVIVVVVGISGRRVGACWGESRYWIWMTKREKAEKTIDEATQ